MTSRALLLALPLLLTACLERAQPAVENAVRPVQAVRVILAPAEAPRSYAGTIRPRREADIAFRASGRMVAREVDMGARVTAGQELARLDPTDLGLPVRSAEADLASAEAQARQAVADALRSRTLLAQGWVATAIDETKQAAARTAQERVASARAALELARNRLDYAVLKAPVDGVVTAVVADPGTVVSEGQPVLRIAQAGELEAEVALPESAVADAGAPATVTLWARPDAALKASLRELSPTADPRLRTYAARYVIENPPAWLALGMTATVRLARTDTAEVASLPTSALADRGDGPMVWVVDATAGRLEARHVHLHALRQDRALVTGLKQGELVVGLGVQKLDPAARVKVADIRPAGE
ncbi:efflux RND transporter periplasmic adaptor subunit [Limobrevibacterium gyesilva]|uniref:Efflux RND transporter periplasmic adaptor subunit n=1 Tax=Limobrevibacterium gyesilva TaxID=2991712 RepID=A0AA42CFH4_9PROT|nr:efflux RND transporter periplasmic adaptor subunit [Limobrevibacterium gyesilva]MCW3477183.1 efflux RND transporter periplasmic adaptor subunit [Limobrevibacterium gyesilva]